MSGERRRHADRGGASARRPTRYGPVAMKALILGGGTFVGRGVLDRLHAAGHDVTVLNRGSTATALPEGTHQLVADRKDWASMYAALDGHRVGRRDRRVRLRAGGRPVGHGQARRAARRQRRALRVRVLDHGLRAERDLPVVRGCGTAARPAHDLRRLQGDGRAARARPPRRAPASRARSCARPPSTARTTTSTTWRRRCSCASSRAGRSWCPTAGSS